MKDFKQSFILPKATIFQTIKTINEGVLQIALVCDEAGKLLGTVTDGDIRRALLRGLTLESAIDTVMNPNPFFVKVGTAADQIQKLMTEHAIKHIPVLDENHVVVGLDFDTTTQERIEDVSVVLMAGGKGQRLLPLTKDLPKPMLKLGDRPILEHIIENLRSCGVQNFFLSVNYKAEVIKNHFGDGTTRDVKITYLEEDQPLGTAGALSLLPEGLKRPFIVMNGDVLTRVNFKKLVDYHEKQGAVATMCLKSFEMDVPYGVVSMNGIEIQQIDEKPVQKFLVNAGIYVFDPSVKKFLNKNERIDMTQLYMKLKNEGARVVGFPLHEYWVDVGRKSDLRKANSDYKS